MLPDEAEIKIRRIGEIDNGCDGKDAYYLLTRFYEESASDQVYF